MNRCATPYCRNKSGKRTHCGTCRSRKSRAADEVRYAYNNLKSSAAKRKIPFTITLAQFRTWCHKVNYIGRKGKSGTSYTVDRRHEDVGYHIDNIQCIQSRDNVKKYWSYDWRSKRVYITKQQPETENLPF